MFEAGAKVVRLGEVLSDGEAIELAAEVLNGGGLVVFPTDTVYGLGVSAARKDAIERLYELKGRDRQKPLARLVPNAQAAERAAAANGVRWTRLAGKLARMYWPGALTIVVGGMGFRVPAHQLARALASRVKEGLLATSANRSGQKDPRTADEALEALGGGVELVLDGGPAGGVPSTVVRADGERPEVLREGAIRSDELALMAPPAVLFVCKGNSCRSPLAAELFKRELASRGRTDFAVLSAGIDVGGEGVARRQGASPLAIGAAAKEGLDLSDHQVQPLTPGMLARADWVFVMERSQADAIAELFPEERARVALLDPAGAEIADPFGGGPDLYDETLARIRQAVRSRAEELLGSGGRTGSP